MTGFENVSFILPLFISFMLIIKNDEPNFFVAPVVCEINITHVFNMKINIRFFISKADKPDNGS